MSVILFELNKKFGTRIQELGENERRDF